MLDGHDGPGGPNRVYHVVTGSDDAVLDGFTVTGGQANGSNPDDSGGGMVNDDSSPTVTSCTFVDNSVDNGGGMRNAVDSSPTVTNCTFASNSATNSGGGMDNWSNSSPMVTNCILWGNTAPTDPQVHNSSSCTPIVTYSNVQNGYAGDGNIDADPLFLGAPADLHLGAGSPCIDAANGPEAPELDLDGNPRIDDPDSPNTGVGPPWADMGAYEYQPTQ